MAQYETKKGCEIDPWAHVSPKVNRPKNDQYSQERSELPALDAFRKQQPKLGYLTRLPSGS